MLLLTGGGGWWWRVVDYTGLIIDKRVAGHAGVAGRGRWVGPAISLQVRVIGAAATAASAKWIAQTSVGIHHLRNGADLVRSDLFRAPSLLLWRLAVDKVGAVHGSRRAGRRSRNTRLLHRGRSCCSVSSNFLGPPTFLFHRDLATHSVLNWKQGREIHWLLLLRVYRELAGSY